MEKKIIYTILLLVIMSIILTACTGDKPNLKDLESKVEEKNEIIKGLEDRIEELEVELQGAGANDESLANNLLIKSIELMEILKEKDFENLQGYIHPNKGVRFTPYPHVDLDKDQVLQGNELSEAFQDSQIYNWGSYDGSGEPIELSFEDYYDRFIYDEDFLNPHLIGNNVIVGQGNAIDNIIDVYPQGRFVEFYFSGFDSEYAGMDWRSLKLVFEEDDGDWYLVAIIHGEWTI